SHRAAGGGSRASARGTSATDLLELDAEAPVSPGETGAVHVAEQSPLRSQEVCFGIQPFYARAMRRAGAPVASLTFAKPTTSVAPAAGTLSRLATFSRPQRPDGNHAR